MAAGDTIAPLVRDKITRGSARLPERTERCVGCRWPAVCEKDLTCWKAEGAAKRGGADALAAMDNGDPQPVELAAGLAQGVTVTLPQEPAEHTRKLLDTLGADYQVDATAPGSCGHRPPATVECPHCHRDTPTSTKHQRCLRCGSRLVESAPAVETGTTRKPGRPRGTKWTREDVIAGIKCYADEHGAPPSSHDSPALKYRAKRVFGSWADAVEAAGYERPRRGNPRRRHAAAEAPAAEPGKIEPAVLHVLEVAVAEAEVGLHRARLALAEHRLAELEQQAAS